MATKNEPIIGLEYGAPQGEGNWNIWMDANLVKLGAFSAVSVINRTTTTPPAVVNGERYIVATGGTGLWSGQDGKLALAVENGWQFYTLPRGILVEDQTDGYVYLWNGTSFLKQAKSSDLSSKQDTLVSGTNIKTVNGDSLLGSGNLVISGGGGGGNLTTDTTINVPADYANLGAALTYAKTLVPVNGAKLTITVDDTEVLLQQITIELVDLGFVVIQGLGAGPIVDATGWSASPFGPTPWITVNLAKLGPIIGTWRNSNASSATQLLNLGGDSTFGSAAAGYSMASGFQIGVAAFLGAKHRNFQATLNALVYGVYLTTGAEVDSANSTYTGTLYADSGSSVRSETDTINGVAANGDKAVEARYGGVVHLKGSTVVGRVVADTGAVADGYILSHSEIATGMSDFINVSNSGRVALYTPTVSPLSGSTAKYIVADTGGFVSASGSNNAIVNTSTGLVVVKGDNAQVLLHQAPNILGSFAGAYSYDPRVIIDTGANRNLSLGDAEAYIRMNNGSPNTVTVPTNASVPYTVGTEIHVFQLGAGATSFVASGGVTINAPSLNISARYRAATLKKVGSDEWDLLGALA